MQRNLWAPWRMAYIRDIESQAAQAKINPPPDSDGDFLLATWRNPSMDATQHVVHRNEHGLILLNRYPYANGHLLAALGDARPRLADYPAEARADFWRLVDLAAALIEVALRPQGLNIGVNEGRAGGAGLPQHVHAHVLPRWNGDTNFMSAVAGVRVIPESLDRVAQLYREALPEARKRVGP
ncbi:MAG: HIT domain-containing protein [Planctomycetes bacterium]|nr:HIT domain-containing protein [Planctomycetota bacterium]